MPSSTNPRDLPTPAALHILLSLAREDLHGYGIKRAVEERTEGEMSLGPGTLYEAIHRMAGDGWIEEVEGGGRKRVYHLTNEGRRVLNDELRRLDEIVRLAREGGTPHRHEAHMTRKGSGAPHWVALLLRIYPAEFRESHGEEIQEFVVQELARDPRARRRVTLGLAFDLGRAALRLRWRPARRRGVVGTGRVGGEMTSGPEGVMGTLWSDARLAARGLLRSRGFSAVVVLTLGLGIGLNTALFSVVNAVLLRPLDYPEPDRLVYLRADLPAQDLTDVLYSGGDLDDLRGVGAFAAVEGITTIRQNLNGAGLPRQVTVGWVSGGFLSMLGATPVLGRSFRPDDPPGMAMLSHELWSSALGGDPAIVGSTVQLDGYPYTILGVLPEDFTLRLPPRGGTVVQPEIWKNPDAFWQNGDIWSAQGPEFGLLRLLGRLGPGINAAEANLALEPQVESWRERFPEFREGGFRIEVLGLHDQVVATVQPTLALLMGAVALVLLIACANVANLLIVRGQARRRETAVRLALGAPRLRVGVFLLVESALLALAGAGLGLILAGSGTQAILALTPPGIPLVETVGPHPAVMGFALTAAVVTTLIVGALPVLSVSRVDPGATLGHGRALGVRGAMLRDALAVAQVALSIVLCVGAGLLTASVVRMNQVELGFEPDGLYSFGVSIPGSQYGWPEEADRFYREVEDRVAALPGVASAGVVWPMPFSSSWSGEHAIERGERIGLGLVDYRLATEGYFATAGMATREGRLFTADDPTHVVVVSRSLSDATWPGEPAVGRTLQLDPWGRGLEDFEVVGVVSDVRERSLSSDPGGIVYFDSRSWSWVDWEVHVLARTDRAEAELLPLLRTTLAEIDGEVPLAHPASMSSIVRAQTAEHRFVLVLVGTFAGVAGLLALIGLYGVISYSVGLRSREFGLRMALGSAQVGIQRIVVRKGVALAALGLLLGLAGAWAMAGLLEGLLFGVTPGDPLIYGMVAVVLGSGAVVATWLPAWRASRLDPVAVLKSE